MDPHCKNISRERGRRGVSEPKAGGNSSFKTILKKSIETLLVIIFVNLYILHYKIRSSCFYCSRLFFLSIVTPGFFKALINE